MNPNTAAKLEVIKSNMARESHSKGPVANNDHQCSKSDAVYATLSIRHESLVPSEVTQLLNIEPTSTGIKGDSSIFGSTKQISGWYLSTKDRIVSNSLDAHVSWLLNQFHGKTPALRRLQSQGCNFIVRCHLSTRDTACLIPLDLSIILGLGKLRAELDFGIRFENS